MDDSDLLFRTVMVENYKDLKKSQSLMNLFNSDSFPPFTFRKNLALLCQDKYLVRCSHEVCNKNNLWFYFTTGTPFFPTLVTIPQSETPPAPPSSSPWSLAPSRYIHTCIHTYIHIHIHIYILIVLPLCESSSY